MQKSKIDLPDDLPPIITLRFSFKKIDSGVNFLSDEINRTLSIINLDSLKSGREL